MRMVLLLAMMMLLYVLLMTHIVVLMNLWQMLLVMVMRLMVTSGLRIPSHNQLNHQPQLQHRQQQTAGKLRTGNACPSRKTLESLELNDLKQGGPENPKARTDLFSALCRAKERLPKWHVVRKV